MWNACCAPAVLLCTREGEEYNAPALLRTECLGTCFFSSHHSPALGSWSHPRLLWVTQQLSCVDTFTFVIIFFWRLLPLLAWLTPTHPSGISQMSPLSKSLPQPSILVSLHLHLCMVSLSYLISFLFLFPACNYVFLCHGLPHQTVLLSSPRLTPELDGWIRAEIYSSAQCFLSEEGMMCQERWEKAS